MSKAAVQKLLDGTLAELSDIETHEVSFVPAGANGLPLLAIKGLPGEYSTTPDADADELDDGEPIILTAVDKAAWLGVLEHVETAIRMTKRAVQLAEVGDESSPDVGIAAAKISKALAPVVAPAPAAPPPDSDALQQIARKILAQPQGTVADTETATLMQRAADRIAQQDAQIQILTRKLERAGARLPAPAADPHVDSASPVSKSADFPVHWKAGKPCGLSDQE